MPQIKATRYSLCNHDEGADIFEAESRGKRAELMKIITCGARKDRAPYVSASWAISVLERSNGHEVATSQHNTQLSGKA